VRGVRASYPIPLHLRVRLARCSLGMALRHSTTTVRLRFEGPICNCQPQERGKSSPPSGMPGIGVRISLRCR
jgi:hypothetical protein